jgi:hypothetical protein
MVQTRWSLVGAAILIGACAEPANAEWTSSSPEMKKLGYHAFTCLPLDPDDEEGEGSACLGVGCHDGAPTFTALGHWAAGHPTRAKLDFDGVVVTVDLVGDERTLEPLGWLLMKGPVAVDTLQAVRNARAVSARTENAGPYVFDMKDFRKVLAAFLKVCS